MTVCYYHNLHCDYRAGLWLCQSCFQYFCYGHSHSTDLGHNVECVVCEREREECERQEDEEESTEPEETDNGKQAADASAPQAR